MSALAKIALRAGLCLLHCVMCCAVSGTFPPPGLPASDHHGPHSVLSEKVGEVLHRSLQGGSADAHTITLAHPVTDTVSKYDVHSDVWTAVAPMSTKRSDHTTTELGEHLYVAGGCSADQASFCAALTNVFEKYDPVANTWTSLPPLPRQRYRHAAVAVGTKLYLIGGADLAPPTGAYYDNLVTEVDVFDTVTNSWSQGPPLPAANARIDLAAFASVDGAIHVLGGYDPQGNYDSSAAHASWTPGATSSWTAASPMIMHRGDFCAVAGDGASAGFVFGGFSSSDWSQAADDLEVLSASTGSFSTLGGTNVQHRGDAGCAGIEGGSKFLVFGGEMKDSDGERVVMSTAEMYDAVADHWHSLAPLPEERFRFSAAAAILNGAEFVYVTGGQLPLTTTRADIPWDSPAAVTGAAGTIAVDAATLLVFSWSNNARGLVQLPDADAFAACTVDSSDAIVLAPPSANGYSFVPPHGSNHIYLVSGEAGECAAGFKLRVDVSGSAQISASLALSAALAGQGQEDWTEAQWSNGGQMLTARSDLTAAAWPTAGHPGSKVYIGGGCNAQQPCPQFAFDDNDEIVQGDPDQYCSCPSVTANFEVYDPVTGKSTALPALPRARYRHASVAMNGQIYMIGGWRKKDCSTEACTYSGEETPVEAVDVYSVRSGTWTTMSAQFPGVPGFAAIGDVAAFTIGTTIYATGGYDAQYTAQSTTFKLDLASPNPVWVQATGDALDVPRGDLCAVSIGEKGYVFGGWTHTNGWCPALSAIEQFDPIDHRWDSIATDGLDRGDAACAAMHGHLYIIGGERRNCAATTGPESLGLAQIVPTSATKSLHLAVAII